MLVFVQTVQIVKLSLIAFECFVAFLVNITFIAVFSRRPQLQNQSNCLNIGLAVSGIVLAVGFLIKTLMEILIPLPKTTYIVELSRWVFYQGILWHCLVLMGCAVDRWTSIMKPLHYGSIVTSRKLTIYIISTGIATAVFSLSTFLYPVDPQYYMLALNDTSRNQVIGESFNRCYYIFFWIWVLVLPAMNIITISIYSIILCVLKKQIKKIRPNGESQRKPNTTYKGVIKLLFIMIYFIACWGSSGISMLLTTTAFTIEMSATKASILLKLVLEVLTMTTSFTNIIFYGVMNKQFRHELKSMIRK